MGEIQGIELRLLRTFCAVVQEGSIQDGARVLGYSQPAVTLHVQQLEGYVGAKVLRRGRDGVTLTKRGEHVLREAHRILGNVQRLRREDSDRTELHIASIDSIASSLLANLTIPLHDAKLKLDIFTNADRVAASVASGDADIGIGPHVPIAGLEFEHLWDEEFVLAVPLGHSLAERRSMSIADIASERIIITDASCAYRQTIDAAFSRYGYLARTDFVVNGNAALYEAVSKGLGIAILPRSFVQVRRPERFATIEISERIALRIGALYAQPLDPALLDLVENLKFR